MRTSTIKLLTVTAVLTLIALGCSQPDGTLTSPDQHIKVCFGLTAKGEPVYSATIDGKQIIGESTLGLELSGCSLAQGLQLISVTDSTIDEHYTMLVGKQTEYDYYANERTFSLLSANGDTLRIIFRVSNDGFAFRYAIDGLRSNADTVVNEQSTFCFAANTRAWLQPVAEAKTGWAETNPSYEEDYMQDIAAGTACPSKGGWIYPALFKSDNVWALISETGLTDQYCASRLTETGGATYKVRFPMEDEVLDTKTQNINPILTFPWKSPWRTVALSTSLKGIVESTIGIGLANPAIKGDYNWVKPGHAAWSWAKLKDESVVYDVQKQFIDYAADMKWEYCLVDVNWDRNIGYDKIKELADYAALKGVGLILWYNSSGSWNSTEYTPKSMLLTAEQRESEFSRLEAMGIKGVKVDFFAGDGQPVMAYYNAIFRDAARHHLMVNCHGTTLPRGWQRTFPNVVTMEAVKGFEFSTFTQEYQELIPTQACMWPFTRNVYDPMDFTPMSLTPILGIERATTNAFEMALPVLFVSGVQHFAETPDGMKSQPQAVVNYLQDLPTTWDRSVFIDGYPGKLFVAARKSAGKWYVAGINGERLSKKLTLNLSELGEASEATLFADSNNKWVCDCRTITNPNMQAFEVELQPNGGFVAIIE